MYTPRLIIRKLILGAVLMTVAILITLLIRENMDVKDPEQALPTITVTVNGDMNLNDRMVFRAGYEWNFLTTVAKNTPTYTSESLRQQIYPVDLAPNSVLDIHFSMDAKTLRIQRASDDDLENFVELADVSDGQIIAPSTPGLYLYQVEAGFGWRGSVRYFFMVRVQQPA